MKNVYLFSFKIIIELIFLKGPEELLDFYVKTNAQEIIFYEYETNCYVPEAEILKVFQLISFKLSMFNKLSFKYLLGLNLNIKKLAHDSFFKGKMMKIYIKKLDN